MLRSQNQNWRTRLCVAGLCVPLLFSSTARATDLGMTPSHVFGLWTSINEVLTRLIEVESSNEFNKERANSLNATSFNSKKPADVFGQVSVFREQTNRLVAGSGTDTIKERDRVPGKAITPSDVFLASGDVLDTLVTLLISKTDSTDYVSGYYRSNEFSGKTPSDVYGLVDLANRRMVYLKN